jgi:diketogulonate reductase-like aldo/keto reductase
MVPAGYYVASRVSLPTGATTSPLGYGCSQLMARTGRAASIRLVEAAYDAGIRHFDVARLYGYGEAEGALGELLARHRDEVTVTTKLGLEPPARSRGLALAKAVARPLARALPPLRRLARERASRMIEGGRFGVADARASLETSLRELRTDRVDLLLLHECRPADLTDELLDFLGERVRDGSVGAIGIATDPESSSAIVRERPAAAGVVQVHSGVTSPTLRERPELARAELAITHSPLLDLDAVHAHAAASERAARWSEALGVDCRDRRRLGELLLAWACDANDGGIVLFSSRDPDNIAANARLELGPERREQVARLAELVRAELPGQPPSTSSTAASVRSSSETESASLHDDAAALERDGK